MGQALPQLRRQASVLLPCRVPPPPPARSLRRSHGTCHYTLPVPAGRPSPFRDWPTMPRTVEVPARGPLSDLLRKAARVEPLPPSAKFLYGASAQSVLGRLKVPEPRRRRIAPCFAPHDLKRRRVRHAPKMLAGIGRGMPLPFRSVLSGAPFPRSRPNRLHTPCTRESRALHAGNWGVRWRTGCVRSMYDQCTVCVRSLYGLCTVFGMATLDLVCREGSHGGIRVSSRDPLLGAPSPQPMPERRHLLSRARYISRARVAVCGCVRICADCGRECTVLARVPSTSEGHTILTRRRIKGVTAFLADRVHTRAAQQPGHSARPRFPARIRRKPKDAGPWGYVCGWHSGRIRCGTAPCRGVYDSASFNGV